MYSLIRNMNRVVAQVIGIMLTLQITQYLIWVSQMLASVHLNVYPCIRQGQIYVFMTIIYLSQNTKP